MNICDWPWEESLVYAKTFIAEYYSYIDVLKTRCAF